MSSLTVRMFAKLGAIAAATAVSLHPLPAQASESVYDCRFDPGASPLTWVTIRHDDIARQTGVSASHFVAGDVAVGLATKDLGREIEFRHEVRNAGQLVNISSYRIDTVSGRATGNVELYGEDGNFIRGGPIPVEGHCKISTSQVATSKQIARAASNEVCHEDNSPTQFVDSQRYCASSILPQQGGKTYGPKNLFWGPEGAAWCEGVAGNGEGESIRIETAPAVSVYAVVIRNGYQRSASTFSNNGRVEVVEIEAAGRKERYTLRDDPGSQRLALSQPAKAATITVRIVSVYPGARYADTCLSGLLLDLEGF
ncbi:MULTISPECIES: NADase-type glycan-binding domain-containing protein [Methyloceanibacter]|nr:MULTISPECIES: hypothetical protein [Methyloceanibacter]